MKGSCNGCLAEKQHREPFVRDDEPRAREKLELVHTDINGPIKPCSHGGSRYFITFTDDHTRRVWVYFMKQKGEALEKFKEFKAEAENHLGMRIKFLRFDNGGEYISHAFKEFCKNNGIRQHFTAPYSPQQNGVAERLNRTLMEMARCMIHGKKFKL